MTGRKRCKKHAIKRLFLLLAISILPLLLVAAVRRTQLPAIHSKSIASACSGSEYREFDFWIGDWDASDWHNPGAISAHVHIDGILDGCVLREDYQDTSGAKGQSFSIYDANAKSWHQTWVTNRGRLLLINGGMQGDAMVLSGEDRTPAGKRRLVRGIWRAVPDGVRESAFISMDEGKTWTEWFDLLFRAHKS